ARWSAALAELDGQTFATWLDARGLRDERLRWYLDYACRDEYGADAGTVSAWAGLHYFAGRQGFHAPGDDAPGRDAVFTWPEGNAWLIQRLALPLAGRLHAGRLVHAVRTEREGVQVDAWDIASGRPERWQARAVVMAVPLFVAARLLADPPPALVAAASRVRYAPWLVGNLALREPLLDRGLGAPASWDNVRYGSPSLGYVDAGHQRLSPAAGPTVITAYWPLTTTERGALLADSASDWGRRIVADLQAAHPDLPEKVQHIDLARHGHAMSIPVPGTRGSPALAALRELRGTVQFAHADLAGYSVFEEAFEQGERAGQAAIFARR
ncbi:MAG: FAD-dependent oxidoreductase, partial [Burkholderiaceae bacterium]|nr:FAD-dependent oxidoreductase [Burkholderiaceae bacterium]